VDSVFAPAKGESEKQRGKLFSERTVAVPNIHAMSNKEFARYLEKLRKLRPQFKAFVEKLTETGPSTQGISPYEPVHLRERAFHKWFIASNTAEEYNSKESCKIQQVPHRTGGLSYSHTSALETLFRTKSQPGIVLQKNMEQARRRGLSNMENSFMVSFAGLLANLRRVNMGGKQTLQQLASQEGFDLQQMSDSIINMRVLNHPKLSAGPKVVGRVTQGLKGVRVEVEVTSEDKSDFARSNPYPPGSREYNVLQPLPNSKRRFGQPAQTRVKVPTKGFSKTHKNFDLINTLRGMAKVK
jgi:hypothetical protein